MANVITYHSNNTLNPNESWSAYVILSNGQRWNVVAFGATEEEASFKINDLYARETIKRHNATSSWASVDASDKRVFNNGDKTHHLAGKVWLIHIFSREKKRVDASLVDEMLATGEWQRGGPRSK